MASVDPTDRTRTTTEPSTDRLTPSRLTVQAIRPAVGAERAGGAMGIVERSALHPGLSLHRAALELARSDDENQNVDIATVLSARREMLQVEIQIAQVEAEPRKAPASLERAVGCQVNGRAPECRTSSRVHESR